jgi:hypothetical protein
MVGDMVGDEIEEPVDFYTELSEMKKLHEKL